MDGYFESEVNNYWPFLLILNSLINHTCCTVVQVPQLYRRMVLGQAVLNCACLVLNKCVP